jgi:hypothetical protein
MISLHKIPTTLILYYIIPYVPAFNITNKILQDHIQKIKLWKSIEKHNLCFPSDSHQLKLDLFNNYKGEDTYIFEGDYIFLYTEIKDGSLSDFIYISF